MTTAKNNIQRRNKWILFTLQHPNKTLNQFTQRVNSKTDLYTFLTVSNMFATIIRRYILFLVFVYRTNGAFVGKIPERVHVQRCSAPLSTSTDLQVDPKEAVKVFGRMAEKYIMLDASAGKVRLYMVGWYRN